MKYGCIGETLKHSFSKEIHALLSSNPYELKEIPREDLDAFLKEKDFLGINVTIPYKQAVIPYLSEISPEASEIGAVNTIVNRDGKLFGYNTDVQGLSALLKRLQATPAGRKVAVLGTGGTSLTAIYVVKKFGGEPIRVSRSGKAGCITYAELAANYPGICGIINTTPVGMYPHSNDELQLNLDDFPRLEFVADAVYHPLRTKLVIEAKKRNIPAEGGLYMLVAQGVRASEIFLDCTYPEETCEKIWMELVQQKQNMVLVGMPGSGKTTVGKLIAEQTGRTFADLDCEIEKTTGKSVVEIFNELGEEGFRKLESKMVQSAADLNGYVLATGGGVILREANVDALRRNGKLYFLDRPLCDLVPTEDRPLCPNRERLEALYACRYDLYCKAGDVRIEKPETPQDAVEKIRKDFFG